MYWMQYNAHQNVQSLMPVYEFANSISSPCVSRFLEERPQLKDR